MVSLKRDVIETKERLSVEKIVTEFKILIEDLKT